MAKIVRVWAREILDSRGKPTVEAACQADTGHITVASVPSGPSAATHEALEIRDNDQKRFRGLGVTKAVDNVNKILGPKIVGQDPTRQADIDSIMIREDGTENKSKLGANAILSVSEAVSKLGAIVQGKSLYTWIMETAVQRGLNVQLKMPIPIMNMINGGLHGAGNLDFQEFWVVPASSKSFHQGLRIAAEIYMAVGENLERKNAIHSVGDEGGYAPNLFTNADAFEVLLESIRESGYSLGRDVFFGLDVAASVFFKNGEYVIRDKTSPLDDNALMEFYKDLNSNYHLAMLEDPFHDEAWDSWKKITTVMGNQVLIIGDDLLSTNPKRLAKAIKEAACNTILVKPNQIGTVTETLDIIKMARNANWNVIVSHRSGETNDWFIADFAVGAGANYVKFGAPARGERVAKYNRLLSVEKELLPDSNNE